MGLVCQVNEYIRTSCFPPAELSRPVPITPAGVLKSLTPSVKGQKRPAVTFNGLLTQMRSSTPKYGEAVVDFTDKHHARLDRVLTKMVRLGRVETLMSEVAPKVWERVFRKPLAPKKKAVQV